MCSSITVKGCIIPCPVQNCHQIPYPTSNAGDFALIKTNVHAGVFRHQVLVVDQEKIYQKTLHMVCMSTFNDPFASLAKSKGNCKATVEASMWVFLIKHSCLSACMYVSQIKHVDVHDKLWKSK